MRRILLSTLIFAAAMSFSRASQAQVQFPAGSIIIPTQSSFQDACGVVSAYGLIYQVLRANDALQAAGQTRITVHWAFREAKASPHRCVPTNLNKPPAYKDANGVQQNNPAWNDPVWNDGCDFKIVNNGNVPVQLIDNTTGNAVATSPSVGIFNTVDTTVNTTGSPGLAMAWPNYTSVKVKYDLNVLTNVTTVQYLGGAFIISAADAPNFFSLLTGTLKVKDINNQNVDFSAFTNSSGTCNATVSGGKAVFTQADGSVGTPGFALAYAQRHYVNLHKAMVTFTADDGARMNATPPHIGLLQTVDHGYQNEDGSGAGASGIKGAALQYYLKSAGLDYNGAAGCPVGGYNVGNSTLCPNGGQPGQIFDNLDAIDFANNVINARDSNFQRLYRVVWAPHWQATPYGKCDATCITNALTNLVSFANANTGFLAECASIGTLEGTYPDPSHPSGWTSTTIDVTPALATQFLTCPQAAGQPGVCDGSGLTTTRGLDHDISNISAQLPMCTDMTTANGVPCVHFAQPGNAFAQVGDFKWFTYSGAVADYFPGTYNGVTTTYRPGANELAYVIKSWNRTTANNPALGPHTMATNDTLTFIQKDNNKQEAQIIYLGGHQYASDVAGTRVALNTVLALGIVLETAESGFAGATDYNSQAYVPTYFRIVSAGAPSGWRVYNNALGSQWYFPYHRGELRSHPLSGAGSLATGSNAYTDSVSADAQAALPAPGSRNVFTYLGGAATTSGVPAGIPSKTAQLGWKPIDIDQGSIGPGCVDVQHIGAVQKLAPVWPTTPAQAAPAPYAGMVAGANGVCDIQEALGLDITRSDLGNDNGASPTEQLAIINKLLANTTNDAQFLQLIRGYCYATTTGFDGTGTPITNPAQSDCNDPNQDDVAALGGFVHSQAAVIPASKFITDLPSGKHRPTVAFIGGLDGQLHAFYVPSDGLDTGYTGPAANPLVLNPNASTVFHTTYSSPFAIPTALTELWSFIPPGQLPFLYTNDARVDASPAVIDVFGDFNGDGLRTWHTVLVASAGGSNRELFALDVTNPLKPALLWDLQSSFDSTKLAYAPSQLADDDLGYVANTQAQAFRWQNGCRQVDMAQTPPTCTPSLFLLPPATDPGRGVTGTFNYALLGASQTVSVAAMRRNNVPVFAAFVATNQPSGQGNHVFAIDVVNGQKIWEWDNPYDTTTDPAGVAAGVGNTAPAGVTLLSKANTSLIDTAYTGDDEGSLWELDSADGLNNAGFAATLSCPNNGSCNLPLSYAFGAGTHGAQPVSTLATLFVVPFGLASNSALIGYQGQTMLAYGTAGTDTVAAITPVVSGAVHLLPIANSGRYSAAQIAADTTGTLLTKVINYGVAIEATGYPTFLTGGERLYGSIGAAGDHLYFATTSGTVTDIDKRGALKGSVYDIDLGATQALALKQLTSSSGGAGGSVMLDTSVAGQVRVVTVTDQQINVQVVKNVKTDGAGLNGAGSTPTSLLGWVMRKSGREY